MSAAAIIAACIVGFYIGRRGDFLIVGLSALMWLLGLLTGVMYPH